MGNSKLSRRDFLRLSALTATSAVLFGCRPPSEPEAEGEVVSEPAAQEPVELTYQWWESETRQEVMNQIIEGFQNENPGVTVDLQIVPWDTYFEKLPVTIKAGTAPDVFFLVSGQLQTYAATGGLLDLTELFPPERAEKFRQAQMDLVTYNGKIMAFPFTATLITVYTNAEAFENAGIEVPTTYEEAWGWDELANALAQVKDANELIYGMFNGGRDFWWLPWFYGNGASLLNEAGDEVTINSSEAEETLSFLQELTRDELIAPPGETTELFFQGQAAVHSDGHWGVDNIVDSIGGAFDLGVTLFPKRREPSLALGGDYQAAYAETQHPAEAGRFVEYLTSPDAQRMYCSRFNYISPRLDVEPDYGEFTTFLEVSSLAGNEMGSSLLTSHRAHPKYDGIRQVFQAEYELVMLDEKTPAQALADMETGIAAVLAE